MSSCNLLATVKLCNVQSMADIRSSTFGFIVLLYGLCGLAFAGLDKTVDEQTGLIGWKLKQSGLELELIQRLPDQTRAFFLARGFPAEIADTLGESCIFQTILRNTGSSAALTVSLKNWRVNQAGVSQSLKLKEVWDQSWSDDDVSKSARLAFRWATFPTEQTFQKGDYNWGMISFGLPAGAHFRLDLVWHDANKKHIAQIENLSCADDR